MDFVFLWVFGDEKTKERKRGKVREREERGGKKEWEGKWKRN